jgi:hypothetical protein
MSEAMIDDSRKEEQENVVGSDATDDSDDDVCSGTARGGCFDSPVLDVMYVSVSVVPRLFHDTSTVLP